MAKHHTVSDSSCEAKYKELAKCAKGVKFIQMLLDKFNLVEYPGLIGEDNQCPIFLAKNLQVSQHTKHINTKIHFIREFISTSNKVRHGKLFKIDTKDNTADIGTKNVEVMNFLVGCWILWSFIYYFILFLSSVLNNTYVCMENIFSTEVFHIHQLVEHVLSVRHITNST